MSFVSTSTLRISKKLAEKSKKARSPRGAGQSTISRADRQDLQALWQGVWVRATVVSFIVTLVRGECSPALAPLRMYSAQIIGQKFAEREEGYCGGTRDARVEVQRMG
jgi:hypothetical protein